MALDSITVGGNNVATDKDVNNRHFQFVKLAWGSEDTVTIVDASNPIPVALKAGSALVGQVDINNYPASSDVTDSLVVVQDGQSIAPAGINSKVSVSKIIVNRSSSGPGTALIAAPGASKKIRVTSAFLWSAGTVNIKFQDDPAGTPADITPLFNLVANQGFVLPPNPNGWFESATANKAFGINLSAAIQLSGFLSYIPV